MNRGRRNILLIGSAQQGKSTLGTLLALGENFLNGLVSPHDIPFPIGNGLRAKTTEITTHEFDFMAYSDSPRKIRVIDTPGIGDDDERKEEKNMFSVFRCLSGLKRESEEISQVVLVVRYPKLMDQNFRRNLNFYRKMFPEVFRNQSNIMLVVTGFPKNEVFEVKIANSGNDVGKVVSDIQAEVTKILGLKYSIITIAIDSLSHPSEEKNFEHTVNQRNYILLRACSVKGLRLNELLLPKTKRMIDRDRMKMAELAGRMDGLRTRCLDVSKDRSRTVNKICELEDNLDRMRIKETEMSNEINNLSDGLEQCFEFPIVTSFFFFSQAEARFDKAVDHNVVTVRVIGGDLAEEGTNGKRAWGIVRKGRIFSRLNATVSFLAQKSELNKERIEDLRKERIELLVRIRDSEMELEDLRQKEPEKSQELKRMEKEIRRVNKAKQSLETDKCTVYEYVKEWGAVLKKKGSVFVGVVENGRIGCLGTLTFKDGGRYDGEFKNHIPDGEGEYKDTTGKKLNGIWKRGKMVSGKVTFIDGAVFEGELRNNKFHGRGRLTTPDGSVLEGTFADNEFLN